MSVIGSLDCILTPLDDARGYCPACDPDRRRPIELWAHRNCRAVDTERQFVARQKAASMRGLVASERAKHTGPLRSEAEVAAILDVCEARGAWPCTAYDKMQAWLADVLSPAAWRPEWGKRCPH